MKFRIKLFLFGVLLLSLGQLTADECKTSYVNTISNAKNEQENDFLLVSLGPWCEVAQRVKDNHLRRFSFPFDWILSLDYQGFLRALEDDFAFFINEKHLEQTPQGPVFNSYYNFYFLHDWVKNDFEEKLNVIRERYSRRINRFKDLNQYKGRVIFIRSAFDTTIPVFSNAVLTKECSKITFSDAKALKDVLDLKFPELDFYLIIINFIDENVPPILDINNVIECKIQRAQREEGYKKIFNIIQDLSH